MKIDTPLFGLKPLQNKLNNPIHEEADDQSFFKLTGDEYYWQHQEQLQQSQLDFNSNTKLVESKIELNEPPMPNDNKPKFIEKNPVETPHITPMKDTSFVQLSKMATEPYHSNFKKSILEVQKYAPGLPVARESEHPNALVVNKLNKEISSISYQLFIKKHHLFVDQNEVELTLNTNDMSSHEANESIKTIKNYLKKKGLFLKKLIINGELHD